MSKVIKGTTEELINWGMKEKDEMSEIEIQTYQPVQGMIICVSGGEYVKTTDYQTLLVSLEKEKKESDYFRLETNRLTDELAKEKERVDQAEFFRDGMQTRVNELSIENENLKETINFWKKLYNEEIAHSKQAEERVKELDGEREPFPRDDWKGLYEHAKAKVKELDDRIEKLVISIDGYAGRIIKSEERAKELERERGACEVCWTVSWEPIEKHEDADGVNTIGPDQPARCGYCWLKKQIESRLKDPEAKNQIYLQDKVNADLKDYTSPNLLVEQLTEKIKELEEEFGMMKFGWNIALERVKELEAELRKGPCCNLICHAEKLQLEAQLASIKEV